LDSFQKIAVLCVAKRSVYRQMPGLECYGQERPAETFRGGMRVIAHPPCAQWSRLKGLSRRKLDEMWLGPLCFEHVRQEGGVLEHPAYSELWKYLGVRPFVVSLRWFGFAAEKLTGLWFSQVEIPRPDFSFELATHCVTSSLRSGSRKLLKMDSASAAATPPRLAEYLVTAVRRGWA